ncbi:MAG: Large-conductance mechanosensitive channel MscMJLR [Methanosaeta sp. PtaB.Bin039]|nr:MAG: Large-conductance mechanosensitive channel MscMJLR [Methanosaeta sp. PtaB.Bin039]
MNMSAGAVNTTIDTLREHTNVTSFNLLYELVHDINPLAVIANIVVIVVIILATQAVAKLADRMLESYFIKIADKMLRNRIVMSGDQEAEVERSRTAQLITRRLAVAAIYTFGLMMIILQIPQLYRLAVALLAGAGLAGLAIGFAAKDALSNIISGVFIAVFQPFRIGDYLTFRDEYGFVEDITLRHTIICTWDKRRIVVPNSVVSTEVLTNWSIKDPVSAWAVNFGIAYDANMDLAKEIIMDVAKSHPNVLKDQPITVRVTDLADSSVVLRVLFSVPKRDGAFETGCDIREEVKRRFDSAGIEIPYPYRNVIIKKES